MAVYEPYVGFFKRDVFYSSPMNYNTNIFEIPVIRGRYNDGGYEEALSQGKRDYFNHGNFKFLVSCSGSHGCRETTISAIKYCIEAYQKNFTEFGNPYIYIHYSQYNGAKLTEEYIKSLQEFSGKFFQDYSPYSLSVHEGKVVLSYKLNLTNYFVGLWNLSLFLYIFRNLPVMASINERFTGASYPLAALYEFLVDEFLKNPSWGDIANPTMALSLFCWNMFNLETEPFISTKMFYQNGPVNAATHLTRPNSLISFVKDVLSKYETSPNINWGMYHFDGLPNVFRSSIESIYAMVNSLRESNKAFAKLHEKIAALEKQIKEKNPPKRKKNEKSS